MKRLLLVAAMIAWSGMASAVVYKWTDAQGKVLYGDRPPDGVHAEVVELLATHAPTSRSAPAKTAETSQSPKTAANGAKDDSTKKAVDEDVSQTRDKQCTEAQDRYKKLIEGRRLYKTGPDGERQYMSAQEVDTERVNAKRDIDAICDSAT